MCTESRVEDVQRELGLRRKEPEKTLHLLSDPTLDLTNAEEEKLRKQRSARPRAPPRSSAPSRKHAR